MTKSNKLLFNMLLSGFGLAMALILWYCIVLDLIIGKGDISTFVLIVIIVFNSLFTIYAIFRFFFTSAEYRGDYLDEEER